MNEKKYLILIDKYANKNWLKSFLFAQKGIEQFPTSWILEERIGDLYLLKRNFGKGIKHYRKSLDLKYRSDILFKLGNSFLEKNKIKIALSYYHQIKEEFPERYFNMAIAYSKISNYTLAIDYLKKILSKYEMKNAYILLVEFLIKQKKYQKAFAFLNKMKKRFHNLMEYYLFNGIIYFDKKMWLFAYLNLKKSVTILEKQDKIFTREIYVKTAIACYKIKRYSEAEETLKNLYYENSYDFIVAEYLLKIYMDTNKFTEAFLLAEELIKTGLLTENLKKLINNLKNERKNSKNKE